MLKLSKTKNKTSNEQDCISQNRSTGDSQSDISPHLKTEYVGILITANRTLSFSLLPPDLSAQQLQCLLHCNTHFLFLASLLSVYQPQIQFQVSTKSASVQVARSATDCGYCLLLSSDTASTTAVGHAYCTAHFYQRMALQPTACVCRKQSAE